jgi:hypothetical protein
MAVEPGTNPVAPIIREVVVESDPHRAFTAFTEHIDAWWPKATHSVYGADATIAVEAGRVVERLGDQETVWGELLGWDPPHGFRMTWHPGTDPDEATEVEVRFLGEGEHVRVRLIHTGWERGSAEVRESYFGGWAYVLGQFAGGG